MRRLILLYFITFISSLFWGINAQSKIFNERFEEDSVKRPYRALYFSQIPNLVIWGTNRFIKHSDFAYVNFHTMADNIKHRPLWDYDMFGTNLLAHPFHGSLDYSAVRVNGLNYYQSIPYVFASSLIWEYLLENEPASYNDQIATTFGGVIWGEVSFRLSSSIINNQSVGFERVCREFFGALTCPMNGVSRLFSGEMWRISPAPGRYKRFPITADVQAGIRWLSKKHHNNVSGYIELTYNYGDPMKASNVPFEFFRVNTTLDPFSSHSFMTNINATGAVYTKSGEINETDITYGIYQHYLYMDALSNKNSDVYFRYTEPACVGIGLITDSKDKKFTTENYINVLFLAAAQASHFELKGRDYNYGFGYGVRNITHYKFSERFSAMLDFKLSQFFTPVGYDKNIDPSVQEYTKFYAMGDKGNTVMLCVKPQLNYSINDCFSISLKYSMINQYTNNRDFPDFSIKSNDCYLGVNYRF